MLKVMNTEKICDVLRVREIKKEGQWKQDLVVLNNKRYYRVTNENGMEYGDFWFKTKKEMECFCIVFSEVFPAYIWTILRNKFVKYRYYTVTNGKTIYNDLHK